MSWPMQTRAAASARAAAAALWSIVRDDQAQHPERDAQRDPEQQAGDEVPLEHGA